MLNIVVVFVLERLLEGTTVDSKDMRAHMVFAKWNGVVGGGGRLKSNIVWIEKYVTRV